VVIRGEGKEYRYSLEMPGPSLMVTLKKNEKTLTEVAVGSLLYIIWLKECS